MIGADVELALRDGDELVPACGLIGGTKQEPKWFEPHGNVQEDNVFAEYAINPCDDVYKFINRNREMQKIVSQLTEREVEVVCAVEFSLDLLHGIGEQAMEFGCDPDFNAYTGRENPAPNGRQSGLRTLGGHIHIDTLSNNRQWHVALCDLYLGVPSVILDRDGARRRELYGRAGAYRPKSYGIEYRTLSNFWCKTVTLMEWAFNSAEHAGGRGQWYAEDLMRAKITPPMLQKCIDTDDVELAKSIIKKVRVPMP